jgi:hypothetical protein
MTMRAISAGHIAGNVIDSQCEPSLLALNGVSSALPGLKAWLSSKRVAGIIWHRQMSSAAAQRAMKAWFYRSQIHRPVSATSFTT